MKTTEQAITRKLNLVINYSSLTIYNFIRGAKAYERDIKLLDHVFVKTLIYARPALTTSTQQPTEKLHQFLGLMAMK